ncbi:alanine racemase [Carboxylicivirga mesophila]|uniref:Alanine racemase n=1 Tax=Carboxylicivirga mesophila TaxID=1166478 RepID=A0ABS5KCE8_9BACT|nr:alanine racemase [Carboxylicivirga mesophila]MBS2212206.1 alanine racemase [Carboxylicivirga mesophila]
MNKTSLMTLDSEAVKNNIQFLKKKIGSKVKLSSVVKANAYGHGIEHLVPVLEEAGVDHFSVFSFDEALRVRQCTKLAPTILIMGWIGNEDLARAINYGFEFFVFSLERLQLTFNVAKAQKCSAKIHLEAETGMNRSGLNMKELKKAISIIKADPKHFELAGFCTHLSGAESISNHLRIQKQLKKYSKMLAMLENEQLTPRYKHVANSAATFVFPKARFDLVRIGIMQYGFWSSAETFIHYIQNQKTKEDPLQRILSWKSRVMAIKNVITGEFIGYGIYYLAQSDIKTALVPIGYACGYSRSLSNKGRVLISGHRCSVIGLVNMNMIIVDITNVPDVAEGDEVVIIGKQGDLEIKVSAFSNISDELNYEVLAHLPGDIERRVV